MRLKKITGRAVTLLALGWYLFPLTQETVALAMTQPKPREVAPDFSLTGLSGNRVRLGDYHGKVVLVNFFASWCPPCRTEMPGFQRTYAAYRGRGFAVIGIALDDVSPSLLRKMKIDYPVAHANDQAVNAYGAVWSIPVSFLIGKDGRIVKKTTGLYPEGCLARDVEQALRERI